MLISISDGTRKKMELLGIKDYPFSETILKSAYREKAKQYHPDLNNGNEKAAAIFRKIKESYEALQPLSMCVTEEERSFEEVKQNKAKEDIFAVYDKCSHCHGTGIVTQQRTDWNSFSERVCPSCMRKCNKCDNGKFTLKSGRKVNCLKCGGEGIILVYKEYCYTCMNKRKIISYELKEYKKLCSYCKGTGKIELDLFNPVIPKGAVL
jgi:DnaJ-class molecular chaperone